MPLNFKPPDIFSHPSLDQGIVDNGHASAGDTCARSDNMSVDREDNNQTDVKEQKQDDRSIQPALTSRLKQDIVDSVKGMYRILDLINEQGSGGLVDKVIIDQDSFRHLVNDLSPGAYASLTKVDFNALDKIAVKPIGVYGNRTEIVALLVELGVVDGQIADALRNSKDTSSPPTLRSGIYVVLPRISASPHQAFVLYWPEDSTWNDDAAASVRRNRVTFMRYLTKITDQQLCFLSPKQENSIVWSDDSEAEIMDIDDEQSDRLFTFEVSKTDEQEEGVTVRPGFSMACQAITPSTYSECGLTPDQLHPRLIKGESAQAFMSITMRPITEEPRTIAGRSFNPAQLCNLLAQGSIRISQNISDDALSFLIDNGLSARYSKPCTDWKKSKSVSEEDYDLFIKKSSEKMETELAQGAKAAEKALLGALLDRVLTYFPMLDLKSLIPDHIVSCDPPEEDGMSDLRLLYPKFAVEFDKALAEGKFHEIPASKFQFYKKRFVMLDICLKNRNNMQDHERKELVKMAIERGHITIKDHGTKTSWFDALKAVVTGTSTSNSTENDFSERVRNTCSSTSDADFLAGFQELASREELEAEVAVVLDLAHKYLRGQISKRWKALFAKFEQIQHQECKAQLHNLAAGQREERNRASRRILVQDIQEANEANAEISQTIELDQVEIKQDLYTSPLVAKISGRHIVRVEPALVYKINVLGLSAEHRQNLQLDPSFVPSPDVNKRVSCTFCLPLEQQILHAQVLKDDRILLIVDDRRTQLSIYLETLFTIGNAIERGAASARRVVRYDKIGRDGILVAYDESKRLLALCAPTKLQLHIFVFEETFSSLQAWGNAVNLAPWYPTDIRICQSCFVSGSEEILLIDSGGQARVFSLVTQQFRPASLSLPQLPTTACSSPDGACVFLSFPRHSEPSVVKAYHWSTFGSTEGITLNISPMQGQDFIITSMVQKTCVHMLELDLNSSRCNSIALDITKKVTEFMFKQKGARNSSKHGIAGTVHNCFIDCHADVWTRFPVVSAVQRQTITSSAGRQQRRLIFVTEGHHHNFRRYFSELIKSFEQSTRKPTGDELNSIAVESFAFEDIFSMADTGISLFRVGEWLVDLLCLIPIHIAITRENRFVPLKDGVSSVELERSLLGAEVGRIVDSLSLGWYESIFQSYMATKPVKVVSSMGEQSVGKSYSLNHLVDTSFAGSAMRTTEGVWMSVTPTTDALIVALDFEGVHSIERSTQEDTLLVLFNTAISNLVLFRNNFALSRDITGLFQSFQSSSTVLDPATNPSLFRSTLVIIIKDVVESDKSEIVREFSLKFQVEYRGLHKIVQEEQDGNFISRLHAGQLNIVPWPVIESKQFYTLFPALKKLLDRQEVTHRTAGEFLHTLKTLMAKLKANDWGALSQTLAAHRAHRLLAMLPNALAFGFSEVQPDLEPLKNLDSDTLIDQIDTRSQFFLSSTGAHGAEREMVLATLCKDWDLYGCRQDKPDRDWITELSSHLSGLVDMRVKHVQEWISSNLARFKTGHANIEELRRALESAVVDIKANVELCKSKCSSCHLSCLLSRRHDPLEPHDCQTSHKCSHYCDFNDDGEHADRPEPCGHSAGHPGKHICAVDIHLCGEPCALRDKKGCLGECTEVAQHEAGIHMCDARVHACGEPCMLKIPVSENTFNACGGTCSFPSDERHDHHVCDNRMCPLECELCKRLCATPDHLHGLDVDAIHLCGQVHSCAALCAAHGTCQIETAPQSIEATFTGRHETFQYTKYSQVAKRLRCVIPIPEGQQSHTGPHCHSTDPLPFHYCETRCDKCGYFCTLPLGHPQQEHETRHGSMSKTRWAVDGPDGTFLELNGRKFSTDDEGAPMMCNLVCQDMGRHVHLDYCRTNPGDRCGGAEMQHITTRLTPHADKPKDWISHGLCWRRSGFKDPYSRDDQTNFAKCDAMCGGPEHAGTATNPPQPSYCTLPVFHLPHTSNQGVGLGYVSNDGHLFPCKNPTVMQQAFHVIFVIDRSGSMDYSDRRPLPGTPVTAQITRRHNNRLGAVYSSLHAFWASRQAALNATLAGAQAAVARRDAYSVILFDHYVKICIQNDFNSSPDQLLALVLPHEAGGGTNYTSALTTTQGVMERNWSTERSPVVIFLSDGECSVDDGTARTLCRSAVALGKPLSFHSVSFGPAQSSSTLRRMAQISLEVQNSAPSDPLLPAAARIDSSFAEALDTVRLAETFLGIAESLRKPRGSLLH